MHTISAQDAHIPSLYRFQTYQYYLHTAKASLSGFLKTSQTEHMIIRGSRYSVASIQSYLVPNWGEGINTL